MYMELIIKKAHFSFLIKRRRRIFLEDALIVFERMIAFLCIFILIYNTNSVN